MHGTETFNADLVWSWGLLTREFFLAIWVAISVLITVYLLGKFHLPHDSPVEKVGPVPEGQKAA